MKETYLHLLWMQSRLPFHQMKLSDGKAFRIVYPGNYNRSESGPDFIDARIEIDGITWVGAVELHVRSSDWYRHRHHRDPAYDSVVLHVVYEHDRQVIIGDAVVPTLELNSVIDQDHFRKYLQFADPSKKLPCQHSIPEVDRVFIRNMLERCTVERIQRKSDQYIYHHGHSDPSLVFFHLLCASFGLHVNSQPFQELANRIPFNSFKKLKLEERKAMITTVSGLWHLEEEKLAQTAKALSRTIRTGIRETVSPGSWKRKGLRPGSDPVKRITQLAYFTGLIRFEEFEHCHHEDLLLRQLESVFKEVNHVPGMKVMKMTPLLFHQIIINAFVPYLFAMSGLSGNDRPAVFALELLDKLPPERNSLMDFWEGKGFIPQSALETQGLLELDKSYCQRKKCLNCTIGMKVLGG